MRRIVIVTAALLAGLLNYPVPAIAAESTQAELAEPAPPKDECLLYLVQCDSRVHSIQDKIDKLNEEIAKGKNVYTPEEIRILKDKLREASRTLDMLMDK